MSFPAVGVHYDVRPSAYHGASYDEQGRRIVSKSLLWDFDKNPWRWKNGPAKEVTAPMKWGSLVDCMALTPHFFEEQYVITPETYKAPASAKKDAELIDKPWNWNATACQEWWAAQDREVITFADHQAAQKAVAALVGNPSIKDVLSDAKTQVALRLDYEALPGIVVPLKGLLDIVPSLSSPWSNALVDLKEVGRLDDADQISRTIHNFGYHVQAALYLDMWNALTGENRDSFIFLFQHEEEPHETAKVTLGPGAILQGREWYRNAVARWADCVTRDFWPSPWDDIVTVELPRWAQQDVA